MDRLTDFPGFTRGVLGEDAGFLDQFDEGLRRAVADRWLVGVHLDDGIVNAEAAEGGEDVLDGVNLDGAFGEGCGAFDGLDFVDIGIDEGLVGDIDAAELEAVVFRGGLEGEGDLASGVERGAFESGGTG